MSAESGPLGQLARLAIAIAVFAGLSYLMAYGMTHILIWALSRLFGA